MSHEANPVIDIPRLFADLAITEEKRRRVAELPIPANVRVTSTSEIKIKTVDSVLRMVRPEEGFNVVSVKAASGVAEQPLGETAVIGALNRLDNAIHSSDAAEDTDAVWFSVENGLFRMRPGFPYADLSAEFDPAADYADRAVAAVHIPGYPIEVQVSPTAEAVMFPREAVHAAYDAEGGFARHTVGSQLAEMGMVADKQNPHVELTVDRLGGPLSRQDQMARAMVRALLALADDDA